MNNKSIEASRAVMYMKFSLNKNVLLSKYIKERMSFQLIHRVNTETVERSNPKVGISEVKDVKNLYGKYTVKSVFAGNQSITDVMLSYVDRKVSLRFGESA